jgi:hypothetical protein
MIQLVRHDPVAAPVPWQEINLPPRQFPSEDHIRRFAVGCIDFMPGGRGQPFDLVKSASSDDSNVRRFHQAEFKQKFGRDKITKINPIIPG